MAEGHQEGRLGYILSLQSILEPCHLGAAIRVTVEQTGKNRVGVHFVFSGVQTDEGDITHSDSEITSEIPIPRIPLLRLTVHPNFLQMAVSHTSGIMVTRTEKIWRERRVIFGGNLGIKEYLHLALNGFLSV